jgi:hypothetical protein
MNHLSRRYFRRHSDAVPAHRYRTESSRSESRTNRVLGTIDYDIDSVTAAGETGPTCIKCRHFRIRCLRKLGEQTCLLLVYDNVHCPIPLGGLARQGISQIDMLSFDRFAQALVFTAKRKRKSIYMAQSGFFQPDCNRNLYQYSLNNLRGRAYVWYPLWSNLRSPAECRLMIGIDVLPFGGRSVSQHD